MLINAEPVVALNDEGIFACFSALAFCEACVKEAAWGLFLGLR